MRTKIQEMFFVAILYCRDDFLERRLRDLAFDMLYFRIEVWEEDVRNIISEYAELFFDEEKEKKFLEDAIEYIEMRLKIDMEDCVEYKTMRNKYIDASDARKECEDRYGNVYEFLARAKERIREIEEEKFDIDEEGIPF